MGFLSSGSRRAVGAKIDPRRRVREPAGSYPCLIASGDTTQDPVNLAAEFKIDGLRVHFEATLPSDRAHFCPGVIIDITSIESID